MDRPDTIQEFSIAPGRSGRMHALSALEHAGYGAVSRLPICLRMMLESIVRNCDGVKITDEHIRALAGWRPDGARSAEVPMVVSRILLQDFTGVPLLCDLAAMREASRRLGRDPTIVEPRVPMDLVVDHSVQVDRADAADALEVNQHLEFARNSERYRFLKWGMQAFRSFSAIPPGIGIVHQVNLEHLARPLWQRDGVYFPDSLVGTDSHTTMINGLGVLGWGVGGIEAEAAMLGQPLFLLMPDVVGVHLHGELGSGVLATDLVLHLTQLLRGIGVVGAFVEFCGAGAASLTVPDRATIANMAPEYGATVGYFPPDDQTLAYLLATARSPEDNAALRAYLAAQGMFGMPTPDRIDYTKLVDFDLATVHPSVAGPRRPQDRLDLGEMKERFSALLTRPAGEGGYGKNPETGARRYPVAALAQPERRPLLAQTGAKVGAGVVGDPTSDSAQAGTALRHEVEMADTATAGEASTAARTPGGGFELGHGDILIAAITSCTNTSNPAAMLAAGLLAKRAVARGLRVRPQVKTSLAPGSRVVTDYLQASGLLPALEALGFRVAAYGCTTCIGNSGPLDARIEEAVARNDLVCAAVLSGNRNFEARIHPSLRANYLMSPPLVVAFAIAGRVGIDLDNEPLGTGADGRPVFLRELWPSAAEIAELLPTALDPARYRERYRDAAHGNPLWNAVPAPLGPTYAWNTSTYIAEPPFFADFALQPRPPAAIRDARALALFGDSVTTDHISPAGAIQPASPAGRWLQEHGVAPQDFNSYGSRRGQHEVMVRGTFANVRIRNLMLPPRDDGTRIEGGQTIHQPSGETMAIYDAAMRYVAANVPTLVFAGLEYGTGSSRDWAAKGTRLLGVRAVVARSFERIHRSNLLGMGVLPLQFRDGDHPGPAPIRGDESFTLLGAEDGIRPRQQVELLVQGGDGGERRIPLTVRIDTAVEADYYRHDGILPYALRDLLGA